MTKNCKNCGQAYEANHVSKKHCSDSCKTKFYNKQKALQETLSVGMTMEKSVVKMDNINPVYKKAQGEIASLQSLSHWDRRMAESLTNQIESVKAKRKYKLHWQAGLGLLGAFGGLVVANFIAKPFMKEKTTETKHKDDAGNMTIITQRVGISVWQIVMLFVVFGAGLALWLFERNLDKNEAVIPTQLEKISKLENDVSERKLSIEAATKGLELIPKFNLPKVTV